MFFVEGGKLRVAFEKKFSELYRETNKSKPDMTAGAKKYPKTKSKMGAL